VKNNGVYGVATGAANVAVLEDPGAVEEARWVRRYSGHAGSAGGRSSETQRVWRILHDGVGSQSLQVTGGCVRRRPEGITLQIFVVFNFYINFD
jgi:hypothetical protein